MSHTNCSRSLLGTLCLILALDAAASAATELARLPVREVTVFKDGHAFVVHEGAVALTADGEARIDALPAPVLGTFWPFATGVGMRLASAAASRQTVATARAAHSVGELLLANRGARVLIHESRERSYAATVVGPPGGDEAAAAEIILLQTADGVRAVRLETIAEVTFLEPPQQKLPGTEERNVLTLRLSPEDGAAPPTEARVGMTYLQKGLRWIPQYRVTLQADGTAVVELQATLLNELIDLEGVTTHLVIGVPTFEFAATLDPLALDQTLDHLSAYFRRAEASGGGAASYSYLSNLSNSIMLQSQVSRMGEYRAAAEAPAGDAINPAFGAGDEDLYLFTLPNLTLRRGARMTVPVGRWTVTYEDLYRLKLPFAPPPELRQHFDSQRQADLAALHNQPKVMHVARLRNSSDVPFTTAPALLLQSGRILAQGLMTYTSVGSVVDLEITAAVNIPSACEDHEEGRIPNDLQFHNSWYQRVNLTGRISVTNFQSQPVRIEIERTLSGTADGAADQGEIARPGGLGLRDAAGWPAWWNGYSWPWWWQHLNPASRIRWTQEIPAGGRIELTYQWHYFWG